MSDQGMPNLADPGRLLLDLAYKHKSEILIVPGPSSVTAAISACRFIDSGFYFVGFLPRKSEERIQKLVSLKNFPDPIILLDTAYRRQNLLQDLLTALGPDRRLMIAMDITGPTERYIEAKSSQIIEILQDEEQDKNFVLIIDRASRKL
jgi:16S rRNA (cytidine1402-2'-O)-methyltransferase